MAGSSTVRWQHGVGPCLYSFCQTLWLLPLMLEGEWGVWDGISFQEMSGPHMNSSQLSRQQEELQIQFSRVSPARITVSALSLIPKMPVCNFCLCCCKAFSWITSYQILQLISDTANCKPGSFPVITPPSPAELQEDEFGHLLSLFRYCRTEASL